MFKGEAILGEHKTHHYFVVDSQVTNHRQYRFTIGHHHSQLTTKQKEHIVQIAVKGQDNNSLDGCATLLCFVLVIYFGAACSDPLDT